MTCASAEHTQQVTTGITTRPSDGKDRFIGILTTEVETRTYFGPEDCL